ncbi:3'-5' exonuclease [Vibrio ezurae]|uniref:Putative nuclease n=1 Tax=Vibrio ezurae NBRC 102218 TaxID=1219080 RepID=U3CNT8_9VIBR|nr:3'-5' exonuclease [Vibrio ezurae]GAD79788.1 putative nuclease [Vibrio ezurae NBRC 102218]
MFKYFHILERTKRLRKAFVENRATSQLFRRLLLSPTPDVDTPSSELDYIVLDLETTGLDSVNDLILSIGWVVISKRKINLSGACHFYINQESQVKPETAIINHITPEMLDEGVSIHDAMKAFYDAALGKVIVAHGCIVEANFINQYLKAHYRTWDLPLIWLDTLCIEKKMAKARNDTEDVDLTLSATRARYKLPEYNGHNALSDALATAELLMAQMKRLEPEHDIKFGYLYKLSN